MLDLVVYERVRMERDSIKMRDNLTKLMTTFFDKKLPSYSMTKTQ